MVWWQIVLIVAAADWSVMILLGNHLRKILTRAATQAVTDGAVEVRNYMTDTIPKVAPLVVQLMNDEIEKIVRKVDAEKEHAV